MKLSNITISILGSLFLGILIFFFVSGTFNTMVKYEEKVNQSWGQVQNVYQRRANLTPNLVAIVRGYSDFEKSTLASVIDSKIKLTYLTMDSSKIINKKLSDYQHAQERLDSSISKIIIVSEKYPDLKSNRNFLALQTQLKGIENRIAIERNNFNDAVKTYNQYIRTFPNNFFAELFSFDKKNYFSSDKSK